MMLGLEFYTFTRIGQECNVQHNVVVYTAAQGNFQLPSIPLGSVLKPFVPDAGRRLSDKQNNTAGRGVLRLFDAGSVWETRHAVP